MKNFVLLSLASVFAVPVCAMDDDCASPLTETQLSDHWVACEGVAADKNAAINDALRRGISMVFGQVMSAASALHTESSERSSDVPSGREKHKSRESDFSQDMSISTTGSVREFKVIYVTPDKRDSVKAHVHARIVNRRSNVDAVIMLTEPEATVELKSEQIKIGPKKIVSGREICRVVEDALCGALSGSKHFEIRTARDIKSSVGNDLLTKKLVGAGMAPSSELLQAGQMLTCDYVLSTKIEEIKYSKKLAQDKTTKKFGQIQAVKIVLAVRLTDVRSGTAKANETLTLDLDNDSIRQLQDEYEDADLLKATLDGLVDPLRDWICHLTK